jgi:hypothetical protein
MSFSEAEKRQWHAARRGSHEETDPFDSGDACDHCGQPLPPGGGNGTEDFRVCNACDSD